MVRPRQACSLPRGVLIRHTAPSPNPPRFSHAYSFLTCFSVQLLEPFWCSKWVMQHIVGNFATSTFQRYKVRANQSLDGRVMAPGSWGVGAVFSYFSDEDSGQTGEAIGESRVASRSWSCNLSYAPGLVDQIAVSRKESARECGCPGGKTFLDLRETEVGLERYGPANRGHRSVFGPPEGNFPVKIPARPRKILAIRELHAVSKHVLFLTHPGFADQIVVLSLHRGKLGFARYSPMNRGCRSVSHTGRGGQPNPAFGPVNGSVKPWSTLVKLGQTSPNSGRRAPGLVLRLGDIITNMFGG
uniref:Uncharacterized protein n=1 Tax=Fagus sylvatica TaxID=28930 RepID=A0A2N9FK24_FAGSY